MDSSLTMCERCDWLCCRVYDIFDQWTGKLIKRAWDKCGYLDSKNMCRIHKKWDNHAGFRDSCEVYDCMEWWPIVTIFSRRIPEDFPMRYAIISSLLEVIRLRILKNPESREDILQYTAELLMHIKIDEAILLSVKVARVKIEGWKVV